MSKKTYTNGEITVIWQPQICQHSARCWKGLIEVFNPHKRPWINMDSATTEQIIQQVKNAQAAH